MTRLAQGPPLPVRLSKHDRLQLEVKSELLCAAPGVTEAEWVLDLWFVLPQATGISPDGYTPDEFYEDVRAYVRLKTPEVGLDELCRADGRGSPLAVLSLLRHRAHEGRLTRAEHGLLYQEAKLLCAMLKTQLRQHDLTIAELDSEPLLTALGTLAEQLGELLSTWRDVREDLRERVDRRGREVLDFTDESISIQIELAALESVGRLPKDQHADARAAALVSLAEGESGYRRRKGWRTVVQEDPGGDFVDQARLLKKYVSSVLHLHLTPVRFDGMARQGALGVAAGLAMGWAVFAQLVMLFAWDLQPQKGVGIGFVTSFSVLAILAYVLKDRIKATTSAALSKRLTGILNDRRHDITLPEAEAPSGRVSERMCFESSSDLPEDVQALRTASSRNLLLLRAEQDVLRYTRQVELKVRQATELFPRLDGLSDILRINVWRWIRTYARARKEIPFVDDDGKVAVAKLDNLYYVDVIVRFQRTAPEPATRLSQLKLALNRRGIVSVEEVSVV